MSTRHDALSPANKLFRIALVETIDNTGATTPIVSGTVSAFLTTSNDPDAVTADASFSVAGVHVGVASPGAGEYPLGSWLIVIPALSATLLDSKFTLTPPYLVVVRASEMRVYEKLHYARSKKAALG